MAGEPILKIYPGGGTGVELNLLLLAHSLEKGMSLPAPSSGFGYNKAIALLNELELYRKEGLNEDRYAFLESLSVLGSYMSFTDNDMTPFEKRYRALSEGKKLPKSGFDTVNMDAIYSGLDLEQNQYFIRSRHSVRSYEKRSVDAETLRKVLELVSCAPSACNRQPVKVYVTVEHEKVKAVSALIPGNKGFEDEVPNWAIVTVDKGMFNLGEPLQWYINGGIYLSYLIESFHVYHIGSCIFQIPASHSNTPAIRRVAAIPKNEAIIAAIGFGYAKRENKFISATRRPVDEVLVMF